MSSVVERLRENVVKRIVEKRTLNEKGPSSFSGGSGSGSGGTKSGGGFETHSGGIAGLESDTGIVPNLVQLDTLLKQAQQAQQISPQEMAEWLRELRKRMKQQRRETLPYHPRPRQGQ